MDVFGIPAQELFGVRFKKNLVKRLSVFRIYIFMEGCLVLDLSFLDKVKETPYRYIQRHLQEIHGLKRPLKIPSQEMHLSGALNTGNSATRDLVDKIHHDRIIGVK